MKQANLFGSPLVVQLNGSLVIDCLAERLILCYSSTIHMFVTLIQNIQKFQSAKYKHICQLYKNTMLAVQSLS